MSANSTVGDSKATSGSRKFFDRLNPLTGEVATKAPACTPEDADAAVAAAQAAFPAWSATGPNERRALFLKAADAFERRREDFVRTMMAEIATTEVWAAFNVKLAGGMLREAAAITTQINGEVLQSDKPGCIAMAIRQAAGVCLGIAPWNAPIILGVRAIAVPVACGNTVVLKASELCPGTHMLIGEVFHEAGFPPGVVNVLTNAPADAPEIVERIIANPAVKRINFTGSTRVGRVIAALAGRHLKQVVLELGGKAPVIVLDDADLDAAVAAVAFGAFINQGQVCMSTERVVVDAAVADLFVEKLGAKAASLTAGDPRFGQVVIGSMVDEAPARHVSDLIDDAVAKGALLVVGGARAGTIVPATVLDKVVPEMRIYAEESFGPVVSIIRVEGVEEAVRVANDTEYGLAAAVFGSDIGRTLAVAKRIESGICHVNGPTVHDEAHMPFGGVKASGYGHFGGQSGIAEFTDLRWITIETAPQHYPF